MRYAKAVAFAAALLLPVTGYAQTGPPTCTPNTSQVGVSQVEPGQAWATVFVNGDCFEVIARMDGKFGIIPTQFFQLADNSSFTIGADFNADPFVNFVFGSLNGGAATLNFDVFFTTPVVGGPYNTLASSAEGGVSATGTGAAGEVRHNVGGYAPAYVSGMLDFVTVPAVDLVGTSPCTATPGSPGSCLLDAATTGLGSVFPAFLTARLSYTHERTTALGSTAATFNGGVELTATAVPEPATVALLASGILLVFGAGAVRRRTV